MAPPDTSSKARSVVSVFTFKWVVTGLICSVLVAAGLVWAQATNAPTKSPTPVTGSKTASGNNQAANQSSSLNNTPQVQAKPGIQLSPAIQQREPIKPRS